MQTPTHANTLLDTLAALPDDALVPVGHIRRLLNGDGDPAPGSDLLDVDEIAALLDRSASTARALCASGRIAAFRLNNREYRCRPADVADYLDRERERHAARTRPDAAGPRSRRPRPLDSWRAIDTDGDES